MDAIRVVGNFTDEQWNQFLNIIDIEGWGMYHADVYGIMRKFDWAHTLLGIDHSAFFLDILGKVLGGIQYTEIPDLNIFYVGTFIMAKDARGKGIGMKIWDEMLKHRKPGQIMAIDSEGEMTEKYRTTGGMPYPGATQAVRFIGKVGDLKRSIQENLKDWASSEILLKQMTQGVISDSVNAFDQGVANRNRKEFLEKYSTISKWRGVEAKDPLTNLTRGYGMTNPAHHGWIKLGPVYGDSWDVALRIIESLVQGMSDSQEVVLHPSSDHSDFSKFLIDAGFKELFRLDRSYSEPYELKVDMQKLYSYSAHVCQVDA